MGTLLENARSWLSGLRRTHESRPVTYRRPSTGAAVPIRASVGQSQLVNVNMSGIEPGVRDVAALAAEVANRDYIIPSVDIATMQTAGVWPPKSGDQIDDANDREAVTNRFQLMSLPGQEPWRWFSGGFQASVRVHTKFIAEYLPLWADAFTGINGTALESHTPDLPVGGSYGGGSDTLTIQGNRIVAGAAEAFRFFNPGEVNTTARVNLSLGMVEADLVDKVAELGLGVRCASSGAGQRNGYYCTLRVGIAGGIQSQRLRMIKRNGGTSTEVAGVDVPIPIDLGATYRIQVKTADTIFATLFDSAGQVPIASVNHAPDAFGAQTALAVFFSHGAGLTFTLPWLDTLEVEQ